MCYVHPIFVDFGRPAKEAHIVVSLIKKNVRMLRAHAFILLPNCI